MRAEDVQVERGLVLDQSSARPDAVIDVVLGSADRNERASSAERAVTHDERRVIPDWPDARLRDDLDRTAARVVVLSGELIPRDADRSDLRLRRQRAALETVDADDGT